MQYFKHFSNMRHDLKIKRVISKYGIEGYGLYNLILESITESLTTQNPIPDLQDTCEDLAEFYNGNTTKINEMVSFMINQNLLSIDEITGRILCNKLYKFLEQSQTRSQEIRDLIKSWNKKINLIEFVTDKSDVSQTKVKEEEQEKNKNKNKKRTFIIPTLQEIKDYIKLKDLYVDADWFFNYFTAGNWIDSEGKPVKNWQQKLWTHHRHSIKKKTTSPQPIITNVTSERKQRENNE